MISLYFHLPFCKTKCDYCHFYVVPDKEIFKRLWMEGIALEWQSALPALQGKEICSVYFGGGTPALIGPERIGKIIALIAEEAALSPTTEITLEANPENVTQPLMAAFKDAGVNRLSLGVQSLSDRHLNKLSRGHSAADALKAIRAGHAAGIDNISADLMYELPGQSLAEWRATVDQIVCEPIKHLSLYNLTIEPHTVFFKKKEQLQKALPDEKTCYEMYLYAIEQLPKAGFTQYEISAFQRDGCISRHNSGYWQGRPFLGLGPSAFSHWQGRRFRNIANINRYVQKLKEGISPIDYEEELPFPEAQKELFVIGLRLVEGVVPEAFQLPQDTWNVVADLCAQGYLEKRGGRLKLTRRGVFFYDTIASELI